MVGRVQSQRFTTTNVRPSNGIRPPGELWLNQPDMRLGMIDPTQTPVDLLPIRVYSPNATYAQGDFAVNAGQLLQARTALAPKPYAVTDWNQFQPISQTDTRYLALAGGTMTGVLTLAGNPTAPNGAANKAYVDTAITNLNNSVLASVSASYLPLAGGNLTGVLGVGGNGIAYPSLGGIWNAHHTAIAWDGSNLQVAADGSYVGAVALQGWVTANYLNLAGGTLSGALTVGGNGISYNVGASTHAMRFGWDGTQIQAWVDSTYIGGLATEAYVGNYLPLTGGVTSGTVRVGNGRLQSSNNGGNPGVSCWDISGNYAVGIWAYNNRLYFGSFDGAGSATASFGSWDTGGTLYVNGSLSAVNGGIGLVGGGGNYSLEFTNWNLTYQSSSGNLVWYRYDGLPLFFCDFNGSLHVHQDVDAGSNLNAGNAVTAQGGSYALAGDMGMYAGGSGRIIQFAGNWYLDWNAGNGDLRWMQGGAGPIFEFRVSDGHSGNDRGAVYGYGAYINLSDERAKTDIQLSPYGLPEILQLNPIVFERTNIVSVRREHGFSAQQVQSVIPEAVVAVTQDSDPLLGINIDPIVAALVNATKDIAARLAHLERIVS